MHLGRSSWLLGTADKHLPTHMNREKMICSILLLISLTSCISGTFVVNVTQTSYEAEENHNVTLEWTFTAKTDRPINSFIIFCELFTNLKVSVLFLLHEGVEVPESQDEQFAGRVQWDKDVLRGGRLRLHVSRLRPEDSGRYVCQVITNYVATFFKCRLNVTAARDRPKPEMPNATSRERDLSSIASRTLPESRGRIGLYCGLALTAACFCLFSLCLPREQAFYSDFGGGFQNGYSSAGGSVENGLINNFKETTC
ncbi:uncharacterized protein LOC116053388 isoform X1 [Sander lucioperca]|uniref:uncharacterized protein LOC116053388 isoform X1 n=1 Tax=Sander lucioperca TaxID=283035 RepID=UPI00125E45AA|nr:uncharacterized protein LOC116053388 isoform X1 [Sander lucioperca]